MKKGTDSINNRKWFGSISLLLLLLPVLFAVAPFLFRQSVEILPGGDAALLQMATERVPEGVFTGAYSRFGFHHPGPLYFYIRYPLYALTGRNPASFYVVSLTIAGLSLWGSFLIVRKSISTSAAVLSAALISFLMFSLRWPIWVSPWNAYVIVLPSLFLLIAVAAYASGWYKLFPLVILAASFTAQTHLGILPAMGLLILLSIVTAFRRRELMNRYFISSIVLAFMLWIPVIVDQFSPSGTGNLSLIFSVLKGIPPAGITRTSVSVWCSLVALMETAPLADLFSMPHIFMVLIQAFLVLARSLLLAFAWLKARKRDKNSFETRLCEVSLMLLFVSIASILSVRGLVEQYLALWISLISPLSWLAIILVFFRLDSANTRRNLSALLIGIVVLAVFTALNVTQIVGTGLSTDPIGYHNSNVESLSRRFLEENGSSVQNQIEITIEDNSVWVEMAGLACNLERHGYEVSIQQDYGYMLNSPNPVFEQPLRIFLYHDGAEVDYRIIVTD